MRYFLFAILSCFFSLASFSKSDVSTRFSISEKDFADTIPIRYTNGAIMVPITINGEEFEFMYDTGAGITILPDFIQNSLFVKQLTDKQIYDFNDEKSGNLTQGIIAEMRIGNLHINGMRGVVSKQSSAHSFILGANELWLHGIIAKIDLRKNILILTDRKNYFDGEAGYKINCDFLSFRPTVHFSMSYGCKGKALFDTGNNSFLVISKKHFDKSITGKTPQQFKQQIIWSGYGSVRQGVNGNEAPEQKYVMKLQEVKIGDLLFRDIPVETSAKYSGIGSRILNYGSIILNPKELCLVYQPFGDGNVVQMEERMQDVGYNVTDNMMKVEMINPNSVTYLNGVRKGAYLIEMNGTPIASYSDYIRVKDQLKQHQTYSMKYRNPSGEIIQIIIPGQ